MIMSAHIQSRERKNKTAAIIGTAIFHALCLLLLWYMMLYPPNPPLDAGGSGMAISLGEPDMGGPSPTPIEEPSQVTPIEQEVFEQENPVATQEIEETPVVETPKKEIKKPINEVVKPTKKLIEKPVETPRRPDERSLFRKNNNRSSESGSGDGEIPGNEGSPDGSSDGSPDGTGGSGGNGSGYGNGNGIGNGNGDGIGSFELKGRSVARRPNVEENSRETGKVVVGVVVDRNGRVIKATPGQKGTTTLSPVLLEKAKQGALETRFSTRSDGPEEQYGTITFIFRFKP